MGQNSKIEWTNTTWNPTRGCSRVSEGCRNCYAEKIAGRFSGVDCDCSEADELSGSREVKQQFHGFAIMKNGEPHWTGKVKLIESKLEEPLHWKKPRRVFVNSMSDLFHEALPDEAIDRVFAVMALCPQHTFQILTKRPARMREYFASMRQPNAELRGFNACSWAMSLGLPKERIDAWAEGLRGSITSLPNVCLGVSVENQPIADERIPLLLQTPVAVRFVSYEPALGPVDLRPYLFCKTCIEGRGDPDYFRCTEAKIDWVICGGESGPGARPFDIGWARSARDQCRVAGVAFFMKQLGTVPMSYGEDFPTQYLLNDRKGGNMEEWPVDLRVRQFPEVPR